MNSASGRPSLARFLGSRALRARSASPEHQTITPPRSGNETRTHERCITLECDVIPHRVPPREGFAHEGDAVVFWKGRLTLPPGKHDRYRLSGRCPCTRPHPRLARKAQMSRSSGQRGYNTRGGQLWRGIAHEGKRGGGEGPGRGRTNGLESGGLVGTDMGGTPAMVAVAKGGVCPVEGKAGIIPA